MTHEVTKNKWRFLYVGIKVGGYEMVTFFYYPASPRL